MGDGEEGRASRRPGGPGSGRCWCRSSHSGPPALGLGAINRASYWALLRTLVAADDQRAVDSLRAAGEQMFCLFGPQCERSTRSHVRSATTTTTPTLQLPRPSIYDNDAALALTGVLNLKTLFCPLFMFPHQPHAAAWNLHPA